MKRLRTKKMHKNTNKNEYRGTILKALFKKHNTEFDMKNNPLYFSEYSKPLGVIRVQPLEDRA